MESNSVNTYYSNTSLGLLLYSPNDFYKKYILKEPVKESQNDGMRLGSLIHSFILDPETINNKYCILPSEIPTTEQMKTYLKTKANESKLLALDEFVTEESVLEKAYKASGYKISPEKVEETSKQYSDYYNYLLEAERKIVISKTDYLFCESAAKKVLEDPILFERLGLNANPINDIITYNEITLETIRTFSINDEDYMFGLKGILDNLTINRQKKTIYLNDVKYTGKSLVLFKESFEFFEYYRQLAVYTLLAQDFLRDELINGYTMEIGIIAIDSSLISHYFPLSAESIDRGFERLKEAIKRFKRHSELDNWNKPLEFLENNVIL
jgi:hypothetical protein